MRLVHVVDPLSLADVRLATAVSHGLAACRGLLQSGGSGGQSGLALGATAECY